MHESVSSTTWIDTGMAALVFALVLLFGRHLRPLRVLGLGHRGIVSFLAGMSSAYVFVHLLPELAEARETLAEAVERLPFQGVAIYFVALIGFLAFYALDHLHGRLRDTAAGESGAGFRLHVGGFAGYVALVGYLLPENLESSRLALLLYTVALTSHLLTVGHALDEEHGEAYERYGRLVLAAAAIAGWGLAMVWPLSPVAVALLLAFVSGAVVMNSAVTELPSEKDGRVMPFFAGSLIYGALLLPLS